MVVKLLLDSRFTFSFFFAEYDNALDVFFPDHPPEVIGSVSEGTLSGNVCSLLPVTLKFEVHTIR